jgi:hypothetical protein
LAVLVAAPSAPAQQRPDRPQAAPDTAQTAPPADTTDRAPRPDSLRARQGPGATPTRGGPPSGAGPGGPPTQSPANAVSFSAQDSLVIRSAPERSDRGTLHGDAKVSYQKATLRGGAIELDFQSGTLQAQGAPSDSAGGRPVFKQGGGGGSDSGGGGGGQSFTGDVLSYNLNTKRGRVVAARTEKRNAFIEGGAVKVFEDSTLFVRDGSYTTCDCPPGVTPSYSLRSDEMKVEGDWVYTGPIQLFLFNVPTPLWLPFGFLPSVSGRRSGPLPPQYGEDRRGFFLKDWGWYFALNPYTDLTLRASVWSKGSFEIRPRFRYNKRYSYNGDLQLTYRRVRIGASSDPNRVRRHEGEIEWQHSQNLSPTARLSGDVNLATSGDFAQRNSDSFDDAVRQDLSSSLRYSKNWPGGGRQFNVSARQNQQLRSGEVRMTLPSLSFSQNSFKPFKQEQRIGDERWYEKITTSYELDVDNQYSFTPRDPAQLRSRGDSTLADSIEQADIDWYEALVDRRKYELATGDDKLYDFQASHRIPLNMSFRVDRYNLSLSPNAQYTSDWYINTVRRVAVRDSTGNGVKEVVERTQPGFYARRDFSTSFSASSEVFGTFPVRLGPFEGLRHRMSPSLSANYRPNFNAPVWGRTRRIRFEDGTVVPEDSLDQASRYDIVSGSPVRSSTKQWSLNFSLRNVFETKRVRVDSTGERRTDKVNLLNLDVSGLSYNFAADSFQVGRRIGVNARTQIDPFNISARSTFSPYVLERRPVPGGGTRFVEADRLRIRETPLTPIRLTDFRLSLSADFSSSDGGGQSFGRQGGGRRGGGQFQPPGQRQTPDRSSSGRSAATGRSQSAPKLTPLDLPWSLNLDFNYSFSRPAREITNQSATLNANFTLNVTPLWRVQGNTGYDFVDDKLSTTRFSISRSLGCWNMSFSWVPFGRFQQYQFNLQVSSGQLSQLLQLQIPNQGGEGRFGGFGQQLRNTASGAAGLQGGGGGFP